MLKLRLITGPILIIVLLALVWLDEMLPGWTGGAAPRGIVVFGLALLAGGIAAGEMATMLRASGIRTPGALTVFAVIATIAVIYARTTGWIELPAFPLALVTVFFLYAISLVVLTRGKVTAGAFPGAGGVLTAVTAIGITLGTYLVIRADHSAWWIVGIVLTTKACDIGAYFTGVSIGRHKLIPWLSPGKTWEGLIGGVVAASLAGLGMAAASRAWLPEPDQIEAWHGLLLGAVFGITGQIGDLSMSLLKRGSGVKDSSSILPGMGGLLDVLDSPMFVAPVAWILLTLLDG